MNKDERSTCVKKKNLLRMSNHAVMMVHFGIAQEVLDKVNR